MKIKRFNESDVSYEMKIINDLFLSLKDEYTEYNFFKNDRLGNIDITINKNGYGYESSDNMDMLKFKSYVMVDKRHNELLIEIMKALTDVDSSGLFGLISISSSDNGGLYIQVFGKNSIVI